MASVTAIVRKSGSVAWRVQFRVDGRMLQETFDDADAADEFGALVDRVGGAAARKVRDLRSAPRTKVWTLRDWTEHYLTRSNGLANGASSGTLGEYKRMAARSFLAYMADLPLSAIDKQQVGKWIVWQEEQRNARTGRPLAAKTVVNYHGLLSTVLNAAAELGHISGNPAYKAKISAGEPREGVFLSQLEFGTILRHIPEYYRPLVLFLATTGCRWGEATAVQWGDFNLDVSPATVRIVRAWKKDGDGKFVLGPPKTKRSRRTISIPASTVAALSKPGKANERVFVGRNGADRIWYGRFRESIWLRAVTAAQDIDRCASVGLEPISKTPTVHDLRHTHASWLIQNGASLPLIQRRLGHESITTTIDRYGHLAPDQLDATASIIGTIAGIAIAHSGLAGFADSRPLELTQ